MKGSALVPAAKHIRRPIPEGSHSKVILLGCKLCQQKIGKAAHQHSRIQHTPTYCGAVLRIEDMAN
jgi:hypothetical protein